MDDILYFFSFALLARLISLSISIKNEKKLKSGGAVEYGKLNSLALTICHIGFYASCITEAVISKSVWNSVSLAGAGIFLFSIFMLFLVIRELKAIWTIKLIISPQQEVNRSFIFRMIRHPNYFLNIIPELTGLALVCQAWYTLAFGLPLYLVPLTIRIWQEEKIMKKTFAGY